MSLLVYSDAYYLPIGPHVFPAQKYRLVQQSLLERKIARPEDFLLPSPAEDADVMLVHGEYYVHKLRTGTLTAREELQMEIPFSDELVDAFWLSAGGSMLAARRALEDGVCINLGGGFHHAFPDHGEGFCMINDVAIAIRAAQRERLIQRAMVIDVDVHQGNGTAVIFGRRRTAIADEGQPVFPQPDVTRNEFAWMRESLGDEKLDVFTISLHQENNYPALKPPSSIDVNFKDAVEDAPYLEWLERAVTAALVKFQPELVAYVAGADPYREDQLGGLSLTIEGLRRRDEYVFRLCKEKNIPVFATFAGGYANKVEDTVAIHCNTVVAAREVYR